MENERHTHNEGSFELVVPPMLIGVGIGVFTTLLIRLGVGLYQSYQERQLAFQAMESSTLVTRAMLNDEFREVNLNGTKASVKRDADKVL